MGTKQTLPLSTLLFSPLSSSPRWVPSETLASRLLFCFLALFACKYTHSLTHKHTVHTHTHTYMFFLPLLLFCTVESLEICCNFSGEAGESERIFAASLICVSNLELAYEINSPHWIASKIKSWHFKTNRGVINLYHFWFLDILAVEVDLMRYLKSSSKCLGFCEHYIQSFRLQLN